MTGLRGPEQAERQLRAEASGLELTEFKEWSRWQALGLESVSGPVSTVTTSTPLQQSGSGHGWCWWVQAQVLSEAISLNDFTFLGPGFPSE